jgi:hypothetical protein
MLELVFGLAARVLQHDASSTDSRMQRQHLRCLSVTPPSTRNSRKRLMTTNPSSSTLESLKAYGVFKPVGHVVMPFASAEDLQSATAALLNSGFVGDEVLYCSPKQMLQQSDEQLANAEPAASAGDELNLVKAHRELAAQGFSFLVVRAPSEDRIEKIASVARRFNAKHAQLYGHRMIEELIEPGSDERKRAAESRFLQR